MKLKYIPTQIVFDLPEADALRIYKHDTCNYQILDKDFVDDIKKEVVTSTYQKVVVEEAPKKKTKKANK